MPRAVDVAPGLSSPMPPRWREVDSNHRSRVRKSGRCQVPAIRPGSSNTDFGRQVLGLPWRAETSNSRSHLNEKAFPRALDRFRRPSVTSRQAYANEELGSLPIDVPAGARARAAMRAGGAQTPVGPRLARMAGRAGGGCGRGLRSVAIRPSAQEAPCIGWRLRRVRTCATARSDHRRSRIVF
jgi:hypothetical protein